MKRFTISRDDRYDRLRYTPSDCFETFPFPNRWDTNGSLEAAGRSYHEYRAALMVENDEGMTKTYNRFNDIYETDPRIVELPELHAARARDEVLARRLALNAERAANEAGHSAPDARPRRRETPAAGQTSPHGSGA